MELPQNDLDRLVFFEHTRKLSESEHAANPLDAENLTRWGGALLELAQFQTGQDCVNLIKEAVTRLEEALVINPKKHDALWCIGNAHTSHAFLSPDHDVAILYFAKATECYKRALEEDPGNDFYMKSLEMASKAPELHLEMQRQLSSQQASFPGASTSSAKAPKKGKNGDLKYDICGWLILAIGIVAWLGMAKSHVPPPQR
ncbi:Mitochondrial import receptor subunit TOM20 [Zostera marina]|uniref:Mitochondrial import receptor subunit TOM20 n=1 Tax=Zostera marina TaxID=29655 RepID=A0A0K9PWB2_ZOSMR|nr:Mitochondrial import receptor subunit TOM20 [Zostera marina]